MFKSHEIIESYQIKVDALLQANTKANNEIGSLKAQLLAQEAMHNSVCYRLEKQLAEYELANTDIHKWRNNYRGDIDSLLKQLAECKKELQQLGPEGKRRVFICNDCEFPYVDEPVSKCDCFGDEIYLEGYINMLDAAISEQKES